MNITDEGYTNVHSHKKISNHKNMYVITLESQLKNKLNTLDQPERVYKCDEFGINSHIATREKVYGVRGEQMFQDKVKQN